MVDKLKADSGVRLAIIRRPRVEIEDHLAKDALFFETYVTEGYAATQIVPLPEIPPEVRFDVSGLEGKPCWVDFDLSANTIRFREWWKE